MSSNIARFIGADVREVGGREHEGRTARVVVATRSYDTTIEDVWDALTNAERIPRWFLPVTGDFRPGGRYQFEGNAGGADRSAGSRSPLRTIRPAARVWSLSI